MASYKGFISDILADIKREDDLLQAWNLLHDFCSMLMHHRESSQELPMCLSESLRLKVGRIDRQWAETWATLGHTTPPIQSQKNKHTAEEMFQEVPELAAVESK